MEQSFGYSETRRKFLKQFAVTSAAMTLGPRLISISSANAAEETAGASVENAVDVHLKINGKDHALKLDPRTTLLDCLRENLHLTGSKKGCDHGQCGACTVHINGRRVNSCLCFAAMHEGTRSQRLKVSVSRKICTRCRLRSLHATRTNAAIAHLARLCRRWRS